MNICEQGWECPKCGRIWAPKIGACGACNDRQTIPFDRIPQRPSHTGTPTREGPAPRFTCEQPGWNFTADDMSYKHQGGDPA